MRSSRLIRKRGSRQSGESKDLDITSLLDVLVILLVFLIQSYNSSGVVFDISSEVKLPDSESQDMSTSGVVVQVSPTTIWVDDKSVYDLKDKVGKNVFDSEGLRIIPLYNELVRKKQLVKQVEKSAPDAQKFTGIINLVVDKSIKYSFMKKLLYTCADAGYAKYKFVVLGEEK